MTKRQCFAAGWFGIILIPDGNKRAAWATLIVFVDLNHGRWEAGKPVTEDCEAMMIAAAANGIDEGQFADWLRERVVFE